MSNARDMMPRFDLVQAADLQSALDILAAHENAAWVIGGGQDSFDWFKDRAKQPEVVVDLNAVEELRGVREQEDGGLEIGSLTTLAELQDDPMVNERFSLLSSAAGRVASPQIRNVGTLGGNLCQDTRCWYYRQGLNCYRAGGNTCYANTPEGLNREHCVYGASRCVAVSPSDTATALVALDAVMLVQSATGRREIPAREFFVGPSQNIRGMTALDPAEVLVAVRLPGQWAGAKFYFEKVADRNTWDFALVSVAAAVKESGNTVEDIRLVFGAVECVPRRLDVIEQRLKGNELTEQLISEVAASASDGAVTLNYNHFKLPLMQNLLQRALHRVES
ncbi:MAG: xanthine dehydrogenase family protein subunit M [Proteobacteria bacterium]|nr:xanthine dehydrogenase family protein subunit M [Pseudomonadota bacterium]